MRCLDESNQKGNPDGPQPGNLSQKLMGWMLPAFPQQLTPRFAADLQQNVELLIELLGATTHARFRQLLQPGAAVARGIDFFTSAGDRQLRYSALRRFITRVRSLVRVR